MTDQELYATLCDTVENRMQTVGKTLGNNRTLWLELAECPPNHADALWLSHEENLNHFLQKTYLTMLQRPIDDGAFEQLTQKAAQQTPEDFYAGLVNGLKSSEEFAITRCVLHNNLYADHAAYTAVAASSFSRTCIPERLLRVYRKMPEPLKKAAKKILGAG